MEIFSIYHSQRQYQWTKKNIIAWKIYKQIACAKIAIFIISFMDENDGMRRRGDGRGM